MRAVLGDSLNSVAKDLSTPKPHRADSSDASSAACLHLSSAKNVGKVNSTEFTGNPPQSNPSYSSRHRVGEQLRPRGLVPCPHGRLSLLSAGLRMGMRICWIAG
jgi:hypothetical protein